MKMKRLCALLLALVLTLGLCSCSIGKKGKYEKAVEAVRNGHYTEAIVTLKRWRAMRIARNTSPTPVPFRQATAATMRPQSPRSRR